MTTSKGSKPQVKREGPRQYSGGAMNGREIDILRKKSQKPRMSAAERKRLGALEAMERGIKEAAVK